MARFKNNQWNLPVLPDGRIRDWEMVNLALMMDLRDALHEVRDELRHLNATMDCHNTRAIPTLMRRIDKRLSRSFPLK